MGGGDSPGVLAENPVHLVSGGAGDIASGVQLVYGRQTPHQLCQFHLLREYRRNIGKAGWGEAKELLGAPDLEQAGALAARIVRLTQGWAGYWCRKALLQGLRHLAT